MSNILTRREESLHSITAADLIKRLDEQYPARCIGPDESVEHARYYAGKRDLVDALLAKLKREES